MIPGLGTQVREFLLSGALGLGLSLCYDWGRVHRRVFPRLTLPVDLLFALLFFLSLMLTSIYSRGLKLYQLLGMALAGTLYFLVISPWLMRPLFALLLRFRQLGRAMGKGMKKFVIFLRKLEKKLFPSRSKWSTIDMIPFLPKGKSTRRRGAAPDDKKTGRKGSCRNNGGVGRMESGSAGKGSEPSRRSGPDAGRSHRRNKNRTGHVESRFG